jgi:hypothetical protein
VSPQAESRNCLLTDTTVSPLPDAEQPVSYLFVQGVFI